MMDASPDSVSVADTASYSGALQFDGINDLVELPTALAAGSNETAFSLEVWFKTTAPTGCLFEVYGSTGGADRFMFLDAGKVCFYVYGTPVTTLCSARSRTLPSRLGRDRALSNVGNLKPTRLGGPRSQIDSLWQSC